MRMCERAAAAHTNRRVVRLTRARMCGYNDLRVCLYTSVRFHKPGWVGIAPKRGCEYAKPYTCTSSMCTVLSCALSVLLDAATKRFGLRFLHVPPVQVQHIYSTYAARGCLCVGGDDGIFIVVHDFLRKRSEYMRALYGRAVLCFRYKFNCICVCALRTAGCMSRVN